MGRAGPRQPVPGATETQGSQACTLRGQRGQEHLSALLRGVCPLPPDLTATPGTEEETLQHLSLKLPNGLKPAPGPQRIAVFCESLHTPQSQQSLPPRGRASAEAQTGCHDVRT